MTGNVGLRFIIERRSGRYHWSFIDLGELHESNRGYNTPIEAVNEADMYRRQIELGRHFRKQREAIRAAGLNI